MTFVIEQIDPNQRGKFGVPLTLPWALMFDALGLVEAGDRLCHPLPDRRLQRNLPKGTLS